MKAEAILKADILDIIFDNRNKNYGAYSLRKFYNTRLYKSLGLTFALVTLFVIFSFLNKEKALPILIISDSFVMSPPPVKADPVPEEPKEKVSPQKAASPYIKTATQIFANNIQIIKSDNISKIENLNDNLEIGIQNIEGNPGAGLVLFTKLSDVPANADPAKTEVDKITPNHFAEVMPNYPGGMQALKKFLEKNLKNPQDIEEGQNIKVKIRFIVGFDGNLKGFETLQDGGLAFNNEVIRVLKKCRNGSPVKLKDKMFLYIIQSLLTFRHLNKWLIFY